jgi:hypothetical protein
MGPRSLAWVCCLFHAQLLPGQAETKFEKTSGYQVIPTHQDGTEI